MRTANEEHGPISRDIECSSGPTGVSSCPRSIPDVGVSVPDLSKEDVDDHAPEDKDRVPLSDISSGSHGRSVGIKWGQRRATYRVIQPPSWLELLAVVLRLSVCLDRYLA